MKILAAALTLVTATYCTPPAPTTRSCPQYEPLLVELAPAGGWDVAKMSRTMFRESRCQPGVRSRTRDSGLLQINDQNHPYLRRVLGEQVDRWTLLDPRQNIRAAAALCTFWRNAGSSCYRAWNGGA